MIVDDLILINPHCILFGQVYINVSIGPSIGFGSDHRACHQYPRLSGANQTSFADYLD